MYSAYDNYFTVQNDDGIWGIYSKLDDAKEAVEKHQADNGYYVKWTLEGLVNVAKRFDGTLVFKIMMYRRDHWECPVKKVDSENV